MSDEEYITCNIGHCQMFRYRDIIATLERERDEAREIIVDKERLLQNEEAYSKQLCATLKALRNRAQMVRKWDSVGEYVRFVDHAEKEVNHALKREPDEHE